METGGLRKGGNYSETTEDFSRDLQETTKIQQGKKVVKILGAFSLMEISRQDIAQSSEMALLA